MGGDQADASGRADLDSRDPSPHRVGDHAKLPLRDHRIPNTRIRELITELGYGGGKILNDYLREVRPRFTPRRTYQRTVYRPGEICQFDPWEPKEEIPVGHGQARRGWVVTCELGSSRAAAGALIFSKQAPDILWGMVILAGFASLLVGTGVAPVINRGHSV